MQFCFLLVLFAILGAAFGHDFDHLTKLGKHAESKLLGHNKGFLDGVATDASTMKVMDGDAGMANRIVQAFSYEEDKCAKDSSFFFQTIAGGQCAQASGTNIKSQLIGCTPPSEGSSKWTINIAQYENISCQGEPLQIVAQFHDENDCNLIQEVSDGLPYPTNYKMKCQIGGTHIQPPSSFMTAMYSPKDSKCSNPLNVQGLVAGACIKGNNTTSTTISCKSSTKLTYHVYNDSLDCSGKSVEADTDVTFPECSSGSDNKSNLVYEKQNCYIPQN
jgi:hypothetical protein